MLVDGNDEHNEQLLQGPTDDRVEQCTGTVAQRPDSMTVAERHKSTSLP